VAALVGFPWTFLTRDIARQFRVSMCMTDVDTGKAMSARQESPGKSDQRRHRQGESPECQHQDRGIKGR